MFRKDPASGIAAVSELRRAVVEDARRLVLEISGHAPTQRIDPMSLGLVLVLGEVASRAVPLSVRSLEGGQWSGEELCLAVVTDQRLLLRRAHGELVSFWWATVVGLEVDLAQQRMVLDFADGRPCGLFGSHVAVPAVMAIACIYGAEGLIRHPSLESLRDPVITPGA